jgi:hypothetical protein
MDAEEPKPQEAAPVIDMPEQVFSDTDERMCINVRPPPVKDLVLPALPSDTTIFTGYLDSVLRDRVYARYLTTDDPLDEIAMQLKVPIVTALRWASQGSWPAERSKLLRVRERDEATRITRTRMEKRHDEIAGQMQSSTRLREAVNAKLEDADNLTPMQLDQLGKALKSASDVSGRAHGIDDAGRTNIDDPEQGGVAGNGKQPLVIVIPGGGLPEIRRSQPDPKIITQDDA